MSLRAWFGKFTKIILKMKYKQSEGDHTLLIKHLTLGGVTTLIVHVDDINEMGNDPMEKCNNLETN